MANAFNFGRTGSDQTALFNKIYSGAFVNFTESGLFLFNTPNMEYIDQRTLIGGKSLQNLVFGDVPDAEEFTPGDEIIGQTIAMGETVSVVDDFIVASVFLKEDQMLQFQEASRLLSMAAMRHREKIGLQVDARIVNMACQAARATSAVTKTEGSYTHQISPGGTVVLDGGNSATYSTALANAYPFSAAGAEAVRAKLRELAYELDMKRIPYGPENRAIMLHPRLKTVLTHDATGQVFSKDFASGNNNQRQTFEVVDGFRILGFPTNMTQRGPLPDKNVLASSSLPSRYAANFSPQASAGSPVAVAMCKVEDKKAVQLVTQSPLKSVVKRIDEKLGWLVFSYIKVGANIKDQECAATIELTSGTQ